MSALQPRPRTVASGRGMGWQPDVPDVRDVAYSPTELDARRLPKSVRLDEDPAMPEVYDQGQLGSCTANALAAAVEFQTACQGAPSPMPSRLFVYYNERLVEGTTAYDAGAQIRDGIKSLAADGVCDEAVWPYAVDAFDDRPPAEAYAAAQNHRVTRYERVRRDDRYWRHALANRRPVTFGFTVYESFEDGDFRGGVMPAPAADERVLGGHAVLAVGYDRIGGELHWRVRNSWSAGWGDGGYFWMPASYTAQRALASDFWALTEVR